LEQDEEDNEEATNNTRWPEKERIVVPLRQQLTQDGLKKNALLFAFCGIITQQDRRCSRKNGDNLLFWATALEISNVFKVQLIPRRKMLQYLIRQANSCIHR